MVGLVSKMFGLYFEKVSISFKLMATLGEGEWRE